ncbi:hypothetical protein M885DRAFT_454794, partial [Pelagophyceae sp. CCMP2097]
MRRPRLTPLLFGFAAYTLASVPRWWPLTFDGLFRYDAHRGWYSWFISSLADIFYLFGFIVMLPQLYINYRLKSVAHLPVKVFLYKIFNTFVDDVFAFVVKMPLKHRIMTFRDDAVFLVFLYQWWAYPTDRTR